MLEEMVRRRLLTHWNFTSYSRNAFSRFYSFVIDMGFTIANACYPMSNDANKDNGLTAAYAATSDARLVQFNNDEKPLLFKALFDTIPLYRPKIRIFSPRSSLYSLIRQYTVGEEYCYPCRGGTDFFFVDAKEGAAYPCGYRGDERLGKYWEINIKDLKSSASCRKCDWECFRDPSELMGPLSSLFSEPHHRRQEVCQRIGTLPDYGCRTSLTLGRAISLMQRSRPITGSWRIFCRKSLASFSDRSLRTLISWR